MKDTLEDLEQYIIDVIIHNRRGLRASMLRLVFWMLSGVYKGAVKLRLYLYRERYIHDHHLGVPVISVGNITVGGTGKTPVVRELLRLLTEQGVAAHGLSRGYGGRLRGPLRVDPAVHTAADVGDEPLMLARAFDLIYHKPVTVFMEAAKAGGAQAVNGLGMLLHQGARAFHIWTGVEPPVDHMRSALEQAVYGS